MAVWFTLNINDQRIGGVEIRRREPLDLSDPAAIADVWSTYDVWRDGKHMGDVRHCYGHGAWKLLALVADLIAAADLADKPTPCARTTHHRGHRWVQLPGHWRTCEGIKATDSSAHGDTAPYSPAVRDA